MIHPAKLKALDRLYEDGTPGWLDVLSTTHIIIHASRWDGVHDVTITPADVVAYYADQARNITSGCRTLAGFTSDWRGVDAMAKEALTIFKVLNMVALKRAAKNYGFCYGLELKA